MRTQREEKKELSKDEAFALKSKMLDEQMEFKEQMKSILTEDQFAKFEKSKMQRGKMKKQPGKRKRG